MKRALIATVYNEANNIERWWDCLRRQSVQPDELAIVDGGSGDGTWEKLQQLAKQSRVPVKLEQSRCNIAAGRNRAIQLTDADIIATTDAGSVADVAWFGQITGPLLADERVDMVGGRSLIAADNDFQKFLIRFGYEVTAAEPLSTKQIFPSGRNSAFRRSAWNAVGGYPEWLTLTAEDALFNMELHLIGKQFAYNPAAMVTWEVRKNAAAYRRMLYGYGYGAAEAQMSGIYFFKKMLLTVCPPALLLSKRRCQHLRFRWLKNAASASGWLNGKTHGRPPPADWRRIDGVLCSPETRRALAGKRNREEV